MVNVWLTFLFMMTACLGALQFCPTSSPSRRGSTAQVPVSRFWYVSFPFLRSVVTPLLIGNFAYQFNNFNIIYLLTRESPVARHRRREDGHHDQLHVWADVTQQRFAVAASYAVLIFMIIGTISLIT